MTPPSVMSWWYRSCHPLATLGSLIAPDEPLWLLAEAAAHKQVGSVWL
ncbi:hypothetical protein [Leeia sp.]